MEVRVESHEDGHVLITAVTFLGVLVSYHAWVEILPRQEIKVVLY